MEWRPDQVSGGRSWKLTEELHMVRAPWLRKENLESGRKTPSPGYIEEVTVYECERLFGKLSHPEFRDRSEFVPPLNAAKQPTL